MGVRIVSGTFFVLTLIATLGFAAHYFTDLVIAAPFLLLIRALCARQLPWTSQRLICGAAGFTLTAAWCLGVHDDVQLPTTAWLIPVAMLSTIAISFALEHFLAEAEKTHLAHIPESFWLSARQRRAA